MTTKNAVKHIADGHDYGMDAEHCPECRFHYSLGGTNALEVVEQAFVAISSAQARRNDAGMDMLAQDLKSAHEVLTETAAELARVKAVNAELVAASQEVLAFADYLGVSRGGESAAKRLRAAILKAEGK